MNGLYKVLHLLLGCTALGVISGVIVGVACIVAKLLTNIWGM